MGTTAEDRVLSRGDILFFLTFALGMAGFWLGGHAGVLARQIGGPTLSTILSYTATVGVFALGMIVLAFVVTRSIKATLVSALVATGLGLVTSQVIIRLAIGHISTSQQVGILTFVLYLCYGFIYVAALAIGRKLAETKRT